jgi:hypothetical protein
VECQQCVIEFCVQLEKSGSEILQLIHQAYGDDAMRQAAVCKWWKHFRDGEMNVKDEPRNDQEVKTTCSTILLELSADGLQHIVKKFCQYFTKKNMEFSYMDL